MLDMSIVMTLRSLQWLLAFVFLALLVLCASAWAQTSPFRPRTGANLLSNPTLNGSSSWSISAGATYDASLSRTADGSGSARIPMGGKILYGGPIAVTPGVEYTFAAYIRTDLWNAPPNIGIYVQNVTCAGQFVGWVGESGAAGNSAVGLWEEVIMSITPSAGVACVSIFLQRYYPDANASATMWVDELYFGAGTGFGSPPAAKTPFLGSAVRVDDLGNFTVNKGGTFQPFFPLCIYSDGARPNAHQFYSNQGFNCDAWGGYTSNLVPCKNAVSSYNPDGMMCGAQVAQYAFPAGFAWSPTYSFLINDINNMKATGAYDHLLWWYWDNENEWDEWANPMGMLQTLHDQDRTVVNTGTRMHPIFILQGSYNATRMYNYVGQPPMADVMGTYADATGSGGAGHAGGFDIILNMQNQTTPTAIVDANIVGPSFPVGTVRSYIYKFLGRGLRSWIMWRDCYANNCEGFAAPVETAGWWPDIPYLRTELDAMLPLIRMPHWTTWAVSHTGGGTLHVGTRDYSGAGHLIILNDSASPKTVTFTLSGLPYTATQVRDYFTNTVLTTVTSNQFTLTIPALGLASGSRVVRLEGVVDPGAPTVTITGPACNPTCTTSTNPFTGLAGTATDTTGVPVGGITVSCAPSCGTPVVTCPSCGPAATSVNWTVGGIALAPDALTTITVTVTDATAKTGTDTLQVTHTTVDPDAPSVTITGPACNPTCTTSTNPFTGLAGTAADTTGVPVGGITVSCTPSCGTPVVTCPSCGPAATAVSWTVGGITLATDAVTTITVKVTDATAKTGTDTLQVTHTSPPAPATLVLSWPLNENTGTTTADVVGTATGSLVGPPTWSTGCVGSGLTFNGSAVAPQYVTNASFPWPGGQAVSIALWVKAPGNTENGTFKFGTSDDRIGAHLPWSDNVLYFDHGHGVSGRVSTNFAPYLNTWTHVVLVSNGTNFRAIYINGALAASNTTVTAAIPALTGMDLGRYEVLPAATTYYYTGQLDQFQVYKGVLTAGEVSTLYNATAGCGLAVTIATPPSTTTATSITLSGTATDDVGVTGLTLACSPGCGSPAVSCPSCGAAATSVTWTATVPLQLGANTITVFAADAAAHTGSAQVTQTRSLGCQDYVHWPMNEGTGSTTADTGTAGAPGSLVATPTWLTGASARVGAGALRFNGTTQYVRNATVPWPAGQPGTVELWVKAAGGGAGNGTFNIGGTDFRIACHIPWSDNIVYCDYGQDVPLGRVQASYVPYLNAWTHVAYVADTSRRALYFNGVKVAEALAVIPPLPALTSFEAGRYIVNALPAAYHNGDIDDVRVFTCVRSDAEILADYTGTTPPTLAVTTSSGSTVVTTVQVQGTASDDVGVTSLSLACAPSCGSPVVTCTPACGPTATAVTWSATVPLQLGPNVVTVTANDGVSQAVTQQVTITLALAATITNQAPPRGRLY
jgi:Concanavalin A-like lectin/glucanases superfamily